ncbi:MAG: ABC transporter permease [Bdellovibrionaceae bacterium]|nr:ABC transporter permease [Pseudobdellovibrionaceae bacterium]
MFIKKIFSLLGIALVIWGVASFSFLLIHLIPGNPVDQILGDMASAMEKQKLYYALGLDQSLFQQYLHFFKDLLHGNFGYSLYNKVSVASYLKESLPATIELSLAAMFMAIAFSIPLGVFSALKKHSIFDNSFSIFSLFTLSTPGFLLGPFLIWLLALRFPIFPAGERGTLMHLFLPALSLALPLGAILTRVCRSSLLDTLAEDYIRTAKAKGLSNFKIYFKHALKNAIGPVITTIGLQFAALLTGTVITETIFDWPGIGKLLLDAINQRDYPIVQACVLVIALIYVFINLLTDFAHQYSQANRQ